MYTRQISWRGQVSSRFTSTKGTRSGVYGYVAYIYILAATCDNKEGVIAAELAETVVTGLNPSRSMTKLLLPTGMECVEEHCAQKSGIEFQVSTQ